MANFGVGYNVSFIYLGNTLALFFVKFPLEYRLDFLNYVRDFAPILKPLALNLLSGALDDDELEFFNK